MAFAKKNSFFNTCILLIICSTQLDKVRKGCGLFHMLHNERTDKVYQLVFMYVY